MSEAERHEEAGGEEEMSEEERHREEQTGMDTGSQPCTQQSTAEPHVGSDAGGGVSTSAGKGAGDASVGEGFSASTGTSTGAGVRAGVSASEGAGASAENGAETGVVCFNCLVRSIIANGTSVAELLRAGNTKVVSAYKWHKESGSVPYRTEKSHTRRHCPGSVRLELEGHQKARMQTLRESFAQWLKRQNKT